ncbi:hypothetical protein GCM10008910_04550 [Faecalicatena orotica]|jgi:hypothetical protein|uniref:hypothetical protein n=1 Tax=Faecalicatena orotica TaxID=1544 RepID=UPI0011B242B6
MGNISPPENSMLSSIDSGGDILFGDCSGSAVKFKIKMSELTNYSCLLKPYSDSVIAFIIKTSK